MNEEILSYIWKFQYFNAVHLQIESGETLKVIKTGTLNSNAGPDFINAHIVLDNLEWIGSVEIHVKASDWHKHRHARDPNYESVILHIVWENDQPIERNDGSRIPTLCFDGIVKKEILDRYFTIQQAQTTIPCASQFQEVTHIKKLAMLDRVLLERLNKKALRIIELYHNNQHDWEETAYQWLGMHLGFKLNETPFLRLTQILPWRLIRKNQNQIMQIEALLFGTAGLIPEESNPTSNDAYCTQLRLEYQYLSTKNNLAQKMNLQDWKFLRLRPAGFPTIRLAQFAYFLAKHANLISILTSFQKKNEIESFFAFKQSEYWTLHFQFGKPSKVAVPYMGSQAAHLLGINVCVPLMVAMAKERNQHSLMENALALLLEIPSENNYITRIWNRLGMKVDSSSDSQALLEWYNQYCTFKRCLECTVGASIIRAN
jgi:hypothetical protein